MDSTAKTTIPTDMFIWILFGGDPLGGLDKLMQNAGNSPSETREPA